MLVALEALRQTEDSLLEHFLGERLRVPPDGKDPLVHARWLAAGSAMDEFRAAFPAAWPPSETQLMAFRTLDHAFGPAQFG
jgi:hypothetical protein